MFGNPVPIQPDQAVFNTVWNYLVKKDGSKTKKARCTCNGYPYYGMRHTLDHNYAACMDQNSARVFYALNAQDTYIIAGGDPSNAFD